MSPTLYSHIVGTLRHVNTILMQDFSEVLNKQTTFRLVIYAKESIKEGNPN